jgi:hypothetical protein
LPAGTIIVGCNGMAEGGMIGEAVELAVPGENNCEVCAATRLPLAQNNTKHSAAQQRRNEIITDVAGARARMRTRFSTQIGAISSRFGRFVSSTAPC